VSHRRCPASLFFSLHYLLATKIVKIVSDTITRKETKAERAEKIYRREQRRAEREARRIARANYENEYATSPPRTRETITPPRYGPRAGQAPVDDEEDIPPRDDQEEWAEIMQWMAQEEMGDPFAGFHMPGGFPGFHGFPGFPLGFGQRIPRRHRHDNDQHQHASTSTSRRAADEVRFERGGPVPDIGHMTDEEYAEWIRNGIRERQHRRDMEDMERRRRERRERDRKREREEYMEREKEERRAAKRRRENARAQEAEKRSAEENRKAERRGWRGRCAALMDGEIVSINLKFADIPWPVYTATGSDDVSVLITPDDITIDNVRTFLFALAADEAKGVDTKSVEDARKKVLRDAIRQFHPDRFFARVLPRVREADRDKVKEGVERTSRLINELMSK